jgi:hypothetical protein
MFKVRLRKLQFGADLVCRLCRHEFSSRDVSDRPEVQEALARMRHIVKQRVRPVKPDRNRQVEGVREGEEQILDSAHRSRPAAQGSEGLAGSLETPVQRSEDTDL